MDFEFLEQVPFGELLSEPVRNGIYKSKEFHGRGCKIVNMGELFAHPRLFDVPMKRVELLGSETEKFLIREGDLLFARRSLVAEGAGKCTIVKEVNEPTTFESSIIRARPDPLKASSEYLYYFFNSEQGRRALGTILRQVAVSGITGSDLVMLRLPLPPMSVQLQIAEILSSIDDKIKLNREMSATLEQMAQALFKSWFVDFDPVQAKAEGRAPEGIDAETAALFPGEFEDSILGPIPKGWQIKRIGDLAARIAMGPFGSRIKTDNFVPQGIPVIRGNNLTDGFNEFEFVYLKEEKANELKSSNAYPGDIVFTHRGTLGQVGFIPHKAKYARYVVSQSQMLLSVDKSQVSPKIIYRFFLSPQGQHALLRNVSQTGVPAIARPATSLKSILFVCPAKSLSNIFDQLTDPWDAKRDINVREIESLISIRELLLPKLFSGQLRIPGIEQVEGGIQ